MAKETYYFSHDSNARNDDKMIAVRMKYGVEGYGIYFMILERLMESTNYMSVKDYNVIAFDLRVDTSRIKSIVEDFGLFVFTEDGKYFYSESFNRRMVPLDNMREQRRLAGKKSAEKRAQKAENPTTVQRPLPKNPTKESKVKEKKVTTNVVTKKDPAAAIAATQTRAKAFGETLVPFMGLYGKEMIRAFYDYWSEPNKSRTKMRFEYQKTWKVSLRLATWAKNEQIKPKNDGRDKYEQKRIASEQRKLESLANLDAIRADAEERRKELEAEGVIPALSGPGETNR